MRRRVASLLVVALVLPGALAAGTTSVGDAPSDQRAYLTEPYLLPFAPTCRDWATEVVGATVVSDSTHVTWSMQVRDRSASPECAAGVVPLERTQIQHNFDMLDFANGRGLVGNTFHSATGIVFCTSVMRAGAGGTLVGATLDCDTRPLGAPLVWSVPIHGSRVLGDGTTFTWDLRGATLPGAIASAASQADGPQDTRYQFMDSTEQFSVTL